MFPKFYAIMFFVSLFIADYCDRKSTKVITRLASTVNEKGTKSYSEPFSYIRTKINFAVLRSCVLCQRGFKSTRRQPAMESSISAVVREGGLS